MNKEFNLNHKEAFKLMLDGKKIIDIFGWIFWFEDFKICSKKNDSYIEYSCRFFLKEYTEIFNNFKEYIDPKITLLEELNELKKYDENCHILREIVYLKAEDLLLKYINDEKVTKAYRAIDKY